MSTVTINAAAFEMLLPLARATLMLAGAAVVVAVLLRLSRSRSSSVHRTVCLLVLLQGWLFLGMPVEIPWYVAAPEASVVADEALAAAPALRDATPSDQPAFTPLTGDLVRGDQAELTVVDEPAASSATAPTEFGAILMLALWVLGMVLAVTVLMMRYIIFLRRLPAGRPVEARWLDEWRRLLAQQGVEVEIPLRLTANYGPLLFLGRRGYELVLPETLWRRLGDPQREAILRHEFAHYQRGDAWKSLLVRLAALPHWFNPAAWWAVRRFDEGAEWACDRAASDAEPALAAAYAKALLLIGAGGARHGFYSPAARGHSLGFRIRRLLHGEIKEDSAMKKSLILGAALALVVIGLARFELTARETLVDEVAQPTTPSQPTEEPPAAIDAGEAAPARPALESISKDRFRFDGRSFYEWRDELLTELKPERRTEAVRAFAAFAPVGYGREAAEAIAQVMRGEGPDRSAGTWIVDQSPTGKLRDATVESLARIAPQDSLPVLIEMLKGANPNGKFWAVWTITQMGEKADSLRPHLLAVARDEQIPRTTRTFALHTVHRISNDKAALAPTLRTFLKDENPEVVKTAINLLAPPSPSQYINGVFNPTTIAQLPEPERFYAPEFEELAKSENAEVRAAVREALKRLGRVKAPSFDEVMQNLRSDDYQSRQDAISAFREMPNWIPDAVPALTEAYRTGDLAQQINVIQTLSLAGTAAKPALPILREATTHENSAIRQLAKHMLSLLEDDRPPLREDIE